MLTEGCFHQSPSPQHIHKHSERTAVLTGGLALRVSACPEHTEAGGALIQPLFFPALPPPPPTSNMRACARVCARVFLLQELTAYTDRSFTFKLSTPQTTWMLKRCAGIEKVSSRSRRQGVGGWGRLFFATCS